MPSKKRAKSTTVEGDGFRMKFEEADGNEEIEGPGMDLEKLKQKYSRPDIQCWGCVHDFCRQLHVGKNVKLDTIWNEYIRNKDSMSIYKLAEHLEGVHRKLFFEPSLEEGDPCLAWPAHVILIHLSPESGHMRDEQTDIACTLHDYMVIGAELKKSLYVQTENGLVPHLDRLEAFNKVNDSKRKMWQLYNSNR